MGEEVIVKAHYRQSIKRIGLDITAFGNLVALQSYLVQVFEVRGASKLKYKDSDGDWIDMYAEHDLKLALKTRQDNIIHIKLEEPVKIFLFDESFLSKVKEMKQTCENLIEVCKQVEKLEKENVSLPSKMQNQSVQGNPNCNMMGFLEQQIAAIPSALGFSYDSQAAYYHQLQQPGMMYYPPSTPPILASPMLSTHHLNHPSLATSPLPVNKHE